MSEDKPLSPDDPDWVDSIVRRALERAANDEVGTTDPVVTQPPPEPEAPTRPKPAPSPFSRFEPEPAQTEVGPDTDRRPETEADFDFGLPTEHDLASSYDMGGPGIGAVVVAGAGRSDVPYPDAAHTDTDAHAAEFFESALAVEERPIELDFDGDDEPSLSRRTRSFLEWGAVIVGALAVALLIKTFLMQAYYIPSSSMVPTLHVGDRVLVNKLSYSFGDIGRGDLVVFNRPSNEISGEDDLIKRVIGFEGETVEIHDGKVFIREAGSEDVHELIEPYLVDGVTTTGFVDTSMCANPAEVDVCQIPDGRIFVMGDNRGGSKDSRVFGPVPDDLVVGRAFLRVWPVGDIAFL